MEWFKNHIVLSGLIVLLVVTFIVGFGGYGYISSTRNSAITAEANLNSVYRQNMSELSAATLKITETLGVADKSADKVGEILMDAISGRYGDKLDQKVEGDTMFNALVIAEAYPDLTATSESYAKVQDVVISAREAFKNKQDKLIDAVNSYDAWLDKGYVRSMILKAQGFPSDKLRAVGAGGDTLYGRAALEKMGNGVMEASAVESFENGTMKPIIVPNDEPKPTKTN